MTCPKCGSSAVETTAERGHLLPSRLWSHAAGCLNCWSAFRVWTETHVNAPDSIVFEEVDG